MNNALTHDTMKRVYGFACSVHCEKKILHFLYNFSSTYKKVLVANLNKICIPNRKETATATWKFLKLFFSKCNTITMKHSFFRIQWNLFFSREFLIDIECWNVRILYNNFQFYFYSFLSIYVKKTKKSNNIPLWESSCYQCNINFFFVQSFLNIFYHKISLKL